MAAALLPSSFSLNERKLLPILYLFIVRTAALPHEIMHKTARKNNSVEIKWEKYNGVSTTMHSFVMKNFHIFSLLLLLADLSHPRRISLLMFSLCASLVVVRFVIISFSRRSCT